jgi:CHAD domain-containing protein
MAAAFFRAGDKAAAASDADEIHDFRLVAKRFRYTLEMFREAYGPGLKALLKSMRAVQTALGRFNDCAATSELLARYKASPEFLAFLEEKGSRELESFRKLWTEVAPTGPRWTRYLARYAKTVR